MRKRGRAANRERLDSLVSLLATTGSRRAAIGALIGVGIFELPPEALAKPGKKTTKDRRHRKKRGRRDQHGGFPPDVSCCGARACATPEPGSTRSHRGFAGESFAGEDLNGSIFSAIDGRGTNLNRPDSHGWIFAEVCLQGATFRGAALAGST
jgi:hypothetical protein